MASEGEERQFSAESGEVGVTSNEIVEPINATILADPEKASFLPESVRQNEAFVQEMALRRELGLALSEIVGTSNNVNESLDALIESGQLDQEKVDQLYAKLSEFMGLEDYNNRLALYLPLEFLPQNPEANSVSENFKATYLESWRQLLSVHDLRESFVRGDILEPALSAEPSERVVKVAHLIPDLVERGYLNCGEVTDLLVSSQDPVLVNNILDTLPVMADKGLVGREDWRSMILSGNDLLKEAAIRTAHAFTGGFELAKDEETELFGLFDPKYYTEMTPNETYHQIEERFEGLVLMSERGMLSEAQDKEVAQMALAGTRLYSTTFGFSRYLERLSDHPNIKESQAKNSSLIGALGSPEVDRWLMLWDLGASEDGPSSEVMSAEKAAQMISRYQEQLVPSEPKEYQDERGLWELFADYRTDLNASLANLQSIQPESPIEAGRIRWELSEREALVQTEYAKLLAESVVAGRLTADNLKSFDFTDHQDLLMVTIKAVGRAAEGMNKTNPDKAAKLIASVDDLFEKSWDGSSGEVRNTMYSFWSRLQALGLIESDHLAKHNLPNPKISSKLSKEDIAAALPNQIELDTEMKKLMSDPQLQNQIFPTLLFFGSSLKGYGDLNADLDSAVFVRPGTPWSDRDEINSKIGRKDEFWLEQVGEALKIQDAPAVESKIAGEDWIHIVLNGAWYGDKAETEELNKKILDYYTSSQAQSGGNRERWLGEIEREALQYRLLHKGYSRFYPRQGGIQTEHSYLIDSDSDFYDPGYRRIATQLFVDKVFLPSEAPQNS